jgi:hypothetical protein
MLSRLRSRLNYANVIATLALFFALSGGAAYAASHYLITSTKQIKPSVLASLKGKAGSAGPAGATGPAGVQSPAGPAGAQGPAGTAGAKGETGPKGEPGAKGEKGIQGEKGTTGFTETLPSGKTEKGTWSYGMTSAESVVSTASISFVIPLAKAPTLHFVETEGADPECPGNVEEPSADKGDLCVYLGTHEPATFPGLFNGITSSSTAGMTLVFHVVQTEKGFEPSFAFGSWAVTAE